MSELPSRRLLIATLLIFSLSVSGCLTLNPTVSADTDESAVFETLTATESWSGSSVRVKATLRSSPEARNVTTLTVIKADGQSFHSTSVDAGQTTVIFTLPPNQNVTLVASNSVNSTLIEKLNVTTGGDKIV